MNKAITSKEKLQAIAMEIAGEKGLSKVSVRACKGAVALALGRFITITRLNPSFCSQ